MLRCKAKSDAGAVLCSTVEIGIGFGLVELLHAPAGSVYQKAGQGPWSTIAPATASPINTRPSPPG